LTEYVTYQQRDNQPFKFRARLNGADFFCTVFWNFYASRLYLKIDDASGRTRSFRPLIGSPVGTDINLALNLRPGKIVWREGVGQFEVTG